MNHCWNGEAAILIIRVTAVRIIIIIMILFFVMITLMMKILEEIDWIMKYFILPSVIFFLVSFLSFMIEQNARVFSSSIIQMDSHEFKTKQQILLDAIRERMVMFILFYFKLQI